MVCGGGGKLLIDISAAAGYTESGNGYAVSEDYVGCMTPSCRRRCVHSHLTKGKLKHAKHPRPPAGGALCAGCASVYGTCHFFGNVLTYPSEGGEIMSDSPRHFTSHDALEAYYLIDCLRHQIQRKSRLLKRDRFLLRKIDHLTGRLFSIYPEMHFVDGSSHSDQSERLDR